MDPSAIGATRGGDPGDRAAHATYKLATLMALIDHCIENLPERADDELTVPIPELALACLRSTGARCGRSTVTSSSVDPTSSSDSTRREDLRAAASAGLGGLSLDVASLRTPEAYQKAIDEITLCLAQQPLHRLQRLPGLRQALTASCTTTRSWTDHVTRSMLRAHGDAIVLKPGVAHGLARLAGLLKPALEIMWVDDVRRMNRFLHAEMPDVAGHLFGRERTAMAVVRDPFKDAFGAHCFYCGTHLSEDNPIDHVLPWSLVGIDGLANLVLACERCNGDKSGALPASPSLTACWSATERCWRRSHPRSNGRLNGSVSLPRHVVSTAASPTACRPGRGTTTPSDSTSASRRGGCEAVSRRRRERTQGLSAALNQQQHPEN